MAPSSKHHSSSTCEANRKNMNPAGYNYLGPGNPLDNGQPINQLDSLAREHDYSYANARDNVDVLESDIEYTGKFALNAIVHPKDPMQELWSWIGALGLGIKTLEEAPFILTGRTNPLAYPKNLPNIITQDKYQETVAKMTASPTIGQVSALGTRLMDQLSGKKLSQAELDTIYTGFFAIGQIIDL